MKKILFMGVALCAVFAMSSCKSQNSAYRKAYEKAQANHTTTTPVVTTAPVTTTTTAPVTTTTTAPVTDYSNVSVRTENVSLVSGAALKQFSVVVGSFGVQANAVRLGETLASKGYASRVVKANTTQGTMFRVIATSSDSKAEAAQSRAALEGQYPGAWLLYQK